MSSDDPQVPMKEENEYVHFASKQRLDRDLHDLEGILRGIAIDGVINAHEAVAMYRWCAKHGKAASRPPFNELVPMIEQSIADGVLDLEARQDIESAISRISTPNAFYDVATNDMQTLHGLLAGVGSDGVMNDREVAGLSQWIEAATNLRGMWPYDDVDSLVTRALADGVIDDVERRAILAFCREFGGQVVDLLVHTSFDEKMVRHGVCAIDPVVIIKNHLFCFTGQTKKATRKQMRDVVTSLGGRSIDYYRPELDYLVICSTNSAAWTFSTYGKKVEEAQNDRRSGASAVQFVQESDFWDAVEEAGGRRP